MVEVRLALAEVLGQLAGLDPQLLGGLGLRERLDFDGGRRLGRLLALRHGAHRVRGVDAGFGRAPRGRHAGGMFALASLGGRHVDQPEEKGR